MTTNHYFTQFNVFADSIATGNTALVTEVDKLPKENTNRSQLTTVYVQKIIDNRFRIRWFQQLYSIQRCGHGTLAAAAYLSTIYPFKRFIFQSDREQLVVKQEQDHFALAIPEETLDTISSDSAPFSSKRVSCTPDPMGYLIAELESEQAVKKFELTNTIIDYIGRRALIISSRSNTPLYHLCFRYFAPQYGNAEDTATGSAASVLWPFWKNPNQLNDLHCYQASALGGSMVVAFEKDELKVKGRAIKNP